LDLDGPGRDQGENPDQQERRGPHKPAPDRARDTHAHA